jgi:hypothetical protein
VLVGDVHGCYDELQQLLQQVQLRHGHDNLIFVGDLVNKGPKSQQVGFFPAQPVTAAVAASSFPQHVEFTLKARDALSLQQAASSDLQD